MLHNEDTRVKLPLVVHLLRLGYVYLSKSNDSIDIRNNIFKNTFKESIERINNEVYSDEKIEELLRELHDLSKYDDLGESYYKRLTDINGIKLIDFKDYDNNTFNVVTELTFKNKEDEFRPDVNILINGIPIAFYEVKKPNNKDGIHAEYDRTIARIKNPAFKHFFNQFQLLLFSNNMEYDEDDKTMFQGSYYTTPNGENTKFNFFREERILDFKYEPTKKDITDILFDNNYVSLIEQPEFEVNINADTPANKFATSLLHKDRIMFIIKYGLVYVSNKTKTDDDIDVITTKEKHIIRYQQIFAIINLIDRLNTDVNKGIIWHTQGSGKTSLAFFMSRYLETEYFGTSKTPSRYFFIVDRLDLLQQALKELSNRFSMFNINVGEISSRSSFIDIMKSNKTGIYVVNIQKFEDCKLETKTYSNEVKNIFFIDEAHRSYNPEGSFLERILELDKNAIHIALTGTPILSKKYNSTDVWGSYIHKYYYNKSIADNYTLKIMQERVISIFGENLSDFIKDFQIKYGAVDKDDVYCHPNYYTKLCKYIDIDFNEFRMYQNDKSLGAMIVCNSSNQARCIHNWFEENSNLVSKLILHDVGSKQDRKEIIKDFKQGSYDVLIVFNMLLTGFDAPRLKKMYLLRTLHKHNLLQGLTRVNRPYTNPTTKEKYEYGYVVDFAGIRDEYNMTNAEYLEELKTDISDFDTAGDITKSIVTKEELKNNYFEIISKLSGYTMDNVSIFETEIANKELNELYKLRTYLDKFKKLYTQLAILKYEEYLNKIDIDRVSSNLKVVKDKITYLYLKEKVNNKEQYGDLINDALEDILFDFVKASSNELSVRESELKANVKKIRKDFLENVDKEDKEYIALYDALMKLIKEITDDRLLNISGMSITLSELKEMIANLNKANEELIKHYNHDERCMRIHKRILDSGILGDKDINNYYDVIIKTKKDIDKLIDNNSKILETTAFFKNELNKVVKDNFRSVGHGFKDIKIFAEIFNNEYLK